LPEEELEDKMISNFRDESRRSLIWGLLLFAFLIIMNGAGAIYILSEKDVYIPYRMTYTLELLKVLYPESYNSGDLIKQARQSILDQLDRYSGYLEPAEMDRVDEEFTGAYGGIGITVVSHRRGLLIMSVREDGPAGRAGVKTGDIIFEVDSTNLADISAYRATYLLRGEENTPVEITIARNEMEDTLSLKLVREKLSLIHIPYAGITDNNNLYIRIIDFETGAAGDLEKTLDTLYINREDSVRGIILDLRGNPGGLLFEARHAADLFLDAGQLIVGIKGRSYWHDFSYYSTGRDMTDGLPLVIIVDRGSASAAEIMAGTLKFAGRALLVGDTTFGKGLVQEYSGLGDGSALRLTTSRYYFEGGVFLNDPEAEVPDSADGIAPDYYFKFIESHDFPLALENSFLMREFATSHQNDIIRYAPFSEAQPFWLEDFYDFAEEHGFHYQSKTTRIAENARITAALENFSDTILTAIDNICDISSEIDRMQFQRYQDYIEQRLYQIALESEFGTAEAYRYAIIPYRRDILLAEKLLAGEHDN
jgi:carboxyl-terminal processing protease